MGRNEPKQVGHVMRNAGVPLKDLGDMQDGRGETAGDLTDDMQVSPLAKEKSDETTSYVSLLSTDDQLRFYARYTVGRDGGQGLAESVANACALKSGDIGRAGIASGVVEDTALEAVAQLAVQPPEGFDPSHKRATGFVVRHIQNAVRSKLNKQFGWNGKRFGGYVPTSSDGRAIEYAGREPEPAECVDSEAELANALAHETERARQLEQVRAALPGGVIPTDRAGRIAALQAFGEGKVQATSNAAEHRFYSVLAKHIRAVLKLEQKGQAEEPVLPPDEHIETRPAELSAGKMPESIRGRLMPVATKSPEQRKAERFVIAWQTSSTAQEAANRLRRPVKSVTAYARRLRMLGVSSLKALPASPGPLVRGVRALVMSAN